MDRFKKIFKLTGFALLGIYGLAGAFRPQLFFLLNGADLLFHEAGHPIFSLGGPYLGIWGGTLIQLLIPLLFTAHFFYREKEPASAAVCLWWFGQNFFHIAPYVKDARAQVLPLIGGEIHDWNYLLRAHHLLEHDQLIGNLVQSLGFFVTLAAAGWGIKQVLKSSCTSE